MAAYSSLREYLLGMTKEGTLTVDMPNSWVQCVACAHRCKIAPGHDGICKVRTNRDGTLLVPFGYVCGVQLDPIEKKPFYHVSPGAKALSFGMLGCDYHCAYCQNWISSQALRDPEAVTRPSAVTPETLVRMALDAHAAIITSTYNEPLITSEWACEIFILARQHGFMTSYVSNGNATPEVLEFLQPCLDLYKVDLKSFRQKNYARLGGRLQVVLDTIACVHRRGLWVEVVTLIVPGFNDSDEELRDIARFLVSVSADIPWHVTAFHPEYKMTAPGATPVATLLRAAEIGRTEGLHYVYAGNVHGGAGENENTRCGGCGTTVVQRSGFRVISNTLRQGCCPSCGMSIPGRW